MESEAAAFASAQQKHNQYMRYGKKPRYIEVFQCSGEDMNLVLTGLQPPTAASKPALLSPGMLSPAQSTPQSPPQATHTISHSVQPPLTLAIPPPAPSHLTQSQAALQAQYIAHQNLIARQQTAHANVAAAAAHQEYILFQNCGLLPHQQAAAAAATAANSAALQPYAAAQQHAQHAAAAAAAAQHPQIIFMTRPTLMPQHHPYQAYGYHLPAAAATATHQWPTAYHHPAAAAAAAVANHNAGLTAVSPLTGVMPPTIKRSYENAFQHDHNAVSNTKRHYSAATAAHTAAALYPHYFPPSV